MPSPVINFTNTPPGSPANGDRYVCGTSPTGAWSGQANKYATYLGSAWEFRTPIAGDVAFDQTAKKFKTYQNSAWSNLGFGVAYTFADSTARTATGTYYSEDVGKLAWQQSDDTAWLLKTVTSPGASATPTWVQVGGSGSGGVTVKEEDGSPSVTATEIKFPNGSLTDNGGGSVSVAFTGGSSAPFDFYPFGVPASPDADDQEFTSGSAPGTDFNIGSVTVTRGSEGLKLVCPSNSSAQNVRGRVFSVTLADGEFVYTHVSTEISTVSPGFVDSGLALVADTGAPTTTAIYTVSLSQSGQVFRQNYSNKSTQSGSATGLLVASAICRSIWLGISRSGTSYTMWASLTGLRWYPLDSQTIGTAPNGVLLFANPYSQAVDVYFRHLRFRTGVGPTGVFQ